MSGIKKLPSQAPPTPQLSEAATTETSSAAQQPSLGEALMPALLNPGQLSDKWLQFTDKPQTDSFVERFQEPGSPVRSILRHQMSIHNQDYSEKSPYNRESWKSSGSPSVDKAIDSIVDKLMFDPQIGVGLPEDAIGFRHQSSSYNEIGKQFGNMEGAREISLQELQGMIPAYGTRGETLGEIGGSVLNKSGQFYTPIGDNMSVSGHGSVTALAARARAYGSASAEELAAEFGVEANVTLLDARGHLEAEQTLDLGFIQAGHKTEVDARLYAGADAWVDTHVSLKNGPRVRVGAGAFAGASADLAIKDSFNIGGREVAGGHVVAKAWAGAGAKLDVDVGLKDGKLDFRFDIGAALGVGLEFDFGFCIDFKAAAAAVKDAVKGVATAIAPYAGVVDSLSPAEQKQLVSDLQDLVQNILMEHALRMNESAMLQDDEEEEPSVAS